MEHEKIGQTYAGAAVPFDGDQGIERLLQALANRTGAAPLEEAGRIIALDQRDASITLEPGGQLELSGAPVFRLLDAQRELTRHLGDVRAESDRLGLTWLLAGYRPFGARSEVPWMPKGRYALMRSSLGARGALALDMMQMTATVQANFDWSDETDMAAKVACTTRISPIVSALFANSVFRDGRPGSHLCYRYEVWRHTDAARCGLLACALEPDFGYAAYERWAANVPMLFLRRAGAYLAVPSDLTFTQFMNRGFSGHHATLADWNDHLTTLFPEVRVKRVIEVRGADVVSPELMMAHTALWKGILYDETARAEASKVALGASYAELVLLQADVARLALLSSLRGRSLVGLARELVRVARAGLDAEEAALLDPLEELAREGQSPAQRALAAWEASGGNPDAITQYYKV